MRDHYELYGMTYGFAAKRATERAGPELAERLGEIEAAMRQTDDAEEVHRLTIEFHATIVAAARSPRVKVLLRGMSGMIPGNFFAEVPGAIDVERKGAANIVRAVRRGDADAAADEYQRTLRRQARSGGAPPERPRVVRPAASGLEPVVPRWTPVPAV